MAFLDSLKIRGVRSYSPFKDDSQMIRFSPLTLILGPNGSGKTTIIEALKFLVSGEEPPLSDSRRNFIHIPSKECSSNRKQSERQAELELRFRTKDGNMCTARRDILPPNAGKTSTPSIQSCFRINTQSWKYINKQDEWGKTIVNLFDLPNSATINNVILCHQENSLWPFSEYSNVKHIFDRIFGCEKYKKEVKYIDTEIKSSKKVLEHQIETVSREKEIAEQKRQFISDRDDKVADLSVTCSDLKRIDRNVSMMQLDLAALLKDIESKRGTLDELMLLKSKVDDKVSLKKSCESKLGSNLLSSADMSDEQLKTKINMNDTKLMEYEKTKFDLHEEEKYCDASKTKLHRSLDDLMKEINAGKVLEMKINETSRRLENTLEILKKSEEFSKVETDNPDETIISLDLYDKELYKAKNDISETERTLADKCMQSGDHLLKLKLMLRDINNDLNSLQERDKTIKAQLEKCDPTSKDLLNVISKFDKMTLTAQEIPNEVVSKALDILISESREILESIVQRINNELMQSQESLHKISSLIREKKNELTRMQASQNSTEIEYELAKTQLLEVKQSEKKAVNKLIEFRYTINNVKSLVHQLKQEQTHIKESNYDLKSAEVDAIKLELKGIEAKMSQLNDQRAKVVEDIHGNYVELINLKQNLEYRKVLVDLNALTSKEEGLENEKNSVKTEYQNLLIKRENLQSMHRQECEQRASLMTKKEQLEHDIKHINTGLTKYEKAYRNLAKTYGRIACTKIVLHDLEKLKDCFEKSVSKFHNQMIVKINELLRIRWKQIYQGQDIDGIELVAEKVQRAEKENYTYYIAMCKGTSKTKMREQSSAGQKALASVVIRMTLAELFVKDFAFIAFDEPTTNLDGANVVSLAKAISTYVRKRQEKSANIQWIIITHDEEFISSLSNEFSTNYYKISKDQLGYSVIKDSSCHSQVESKCEEEQESELLQI